MMTVRSVHDRLHNLASIAVERHGLQKAQAAETAGMAVLLLLTHLPILALHQEQEAMTKV